jgi:hypothetical protein
VLPNRRLGCAVSLTDEHLDDLLPRGEALDEDVGRLELMRGRVLLDLLGVSAGSSDDSAIHSTRLLLRGGWMRLQRNLSFRRYQSRCRCGRCRCSLRWLCPAPPPKHNRPPRRTSSHLDLPISTSAPLSAPRLDKRPKPPGPIHSPTTGSSTASSPPLSRCGTPCRIGTSWRMSVVRVGVRRGLRRINDRTSRVRMDSGLARGSERNGRMELRGETETETAARERGG